MATDPQSNPQPQPMVIAEMRPGLSPATYLDAAKIISAQQPGSILKLYSNGEHTDKIITKSSFKTMLGLGNVLRQETGLRCLIEIYSGQYLDEMLKNGFDRFYISASTTVNQFALRDIGGSLASAPNSVVMIENPLHPDIDDWAHAISAFVDAGFKNVIAVHRGFTAYSSTRAKRKRDPVWPLFIELRQRFPGLGIVCSPCDLSCSVGELDIIAQRAIDLDSRGLLLAVEASEAHPVEGDNIRIEISELDAFLAKLKLKSQIFDEHGYKEKIGEMRNQIDQLDYSLLEMLSARQKIVDEIGKVKSLNSVTPLQSQRWRHLLADRLTQGKSLMLDEEYVKMIFEAIHTESVKRQSKGKPCD